MLAKLPDKMFHIVVTTQRRNFRFILVREKEQIFCHRDPCLDYIVNGTDSKGLFVNMLEVGNAYHYPFRHILHRLGSLRAAVDIEADIKKAGVLGILLAFDACLCQMLADADKE